MCGIFILLDENIVSIHATSKIQQFVDNRGPDYQSPLINYASGACKFILRSSVLYLRGDKIQEQPVLDDASNVLMFNGQIYLYDSQSLQPSQSDTSFLSEKLKGCNNPSQIADTLSKIEGPFALVYWHSASKTLIYGRDLFGRKSLCRLAKGSASPVIISSIADDSLECDGLVWSEVSCDGCHCIDFTHNERPRNYTFRWNLDRIYPMTVKCQQISSQPKEGGPITISYLSPLNPDPTPPSAFSMIQLNAVVNDLERRFLNAVMSRIDLNKTTCLNCRKFETLHCTHAKVAVAFSGGIDSTIIALALDKILDKGESIDLITVAFKAESPDRLSVGCAFRELLKLAPKRRWRLVLCDISKTDLQMTRDAIIRKLILPCKSVFDDGIGCACWFVGRAKGRAFEATANQDRSATNLELFLRYDPPSAIGDKIGVENYTSPASILYAGSSVDEQLGGYSSHRSAWSRHGHKGLLDEVSFLMRRLSGRNLGRDDRAYCDHGRDLKLPFLSYEFISYLNELPMGLKMNLDEPLDIGPKKILRLLAFKWGLHETGRRVKRAMQFGTRIANLENNKEKGDEICSRLVKTDESLRS